MINQDKHCIKAKELFIKYNGSHFHMEREMEYTQYKSYGISPKMEKEWSVELRNALLVKLEGEKDQKKITNTVFDLKDLIIQYYDELGLASLVSYVEKNVSMLDTFTKLTIAETILNVLGEFNIFTKNKRKYANFAIGILEDICTKPVRISEYHLENGKIPDFMENAILIERAKNGVRAWKKFNIK